MNLTVTQLDEMEVGEKVVDRDGDVWTKGLGVWHTPETAPFTAEVLVRKWSPLRPMREIVLPDTELPGMWETSDFEGGPDVVRGPDWKPGDPDRFEEKRRDFLKNYGTGPLSRFVATNPPLQQEPRQNPFSFPMLRREEEIVFEEGRGSYPTGRYRLVTDWMDGESGI